MKISVIIGFRRTNRGPRSKSYHCQSGGSWHLTADTSGRSVGCLSIVSSPCRYFTSFKNLLRERLIKVTCLASRKRVVPCEVTNGNSSVSLLLLLDTGAIGLCSQQSHVRALDSKKCLLAHVQCQQPTGGRFAPGGFCLCEFCLFGYTLD